MMGRVSLVAHRGQPLTYPENSLQGFEFVLNQGASYIETDIQISADGVPILSHEANLLKISGKQIIIADHEYEELKDISAGYPERFGERFESYRLSTLNQFVNLLKDYPDVTCFIELKEAALDNFGSKAIDIVVQEIEPIRNQIVLISFEYEALLTAKQNYSFPIGWVISELSEESMQKAIELQPDYLFINTRLCPQDASEIWQGNWEWIAYTVNDSEQIEQLVGLGIELIETDRFSDIRKESHNIEVSHDF